MSSLAESHKQFLLETARRAIIHAVKRGGAPGAIPGEEQRQSASEHVAVRAGAFVTLRSRGRLRGCIGQISSERPVMEVVAYCARAAALEDPRFSPVQLEELDFIEIEISVLSAPQDISVESIRAGEHGLIVSRGWQRGVLLPHVATEFRWSGLRLLEETCVKAGLPRDAWRHPETKIEAFTAEVFSEREFGPAGARPVSDYSSST